MMTDPIADMLSRIRNAGRAGHAEVQIPSSRFKLAIARVLHDAGYLGAIREQGEGARSSFAVDVRYDDAGQPLIGVIRRVSRPGRRVYVGRDGVRRVRNGLGIAVLSTSKGVLSDHAAREAEVGGEILCEVW